MIRPGSDKNWFIHTQPLRVNMETSQDCLAIGKLIATKVVLNEFNAFADLQSALDAKEIEYRCKKKRGNLVM